MIYYLIYSSFATANFSNEELLDLLEVSQNHNKNDGITGMLYYYDGSFIQLLEGEETKVLLTYERICSDKRHRSVVMLKNGFVNNRFFFDWAMSFKRLSSTDYQIKTGSNSQGGDIDINAVLYLFEILD